MSNDTLLSRPAFTDEDTFKLIHKFGKQYFQSNDEQRKQIARKIQDENHFEIKFTADAIGIRLNYLLAYYNTLKSKQTSKIKWKYFEAMQNIMKECENDASSEESPQSRSGNKRGRSKAIKNTVKEPLHKKARLFIQHLVGTSAREIKEESRALPPIETPKEEPINVEKQETVQTPTVEYKKEEMILNNGTSRTVNTSMVNINRTETPNRCQIQQKTFIDIKDGVNQLLVNSSATLQELQGINKSIIKGNQINSQILEQEKANGEKLDEINFHLKSIAGSFKILFDIEKNRLQNDKNRPKN